MSNLSLIVGLGKTGLSCARYLHQQGKAVKVVDSRANPPELAHLRQEMAAVPYQLGPFRAQDFQGVAQIIVSPGVATQAPCIVAAKAAGIPVLGDIELFAQAVRAPVIAVTGSNGKSTVVTLLAAMAKQAGRVVALGGNIGTPALDLLATEGVDLYILELSSFQLETTYTLQPLAASVLNISPDHLDRYENLAAYIQAKQNIYSSAQYCIVNRQDAHVQAMVSQQAQDYSFGLNPPSHPQAFGVIQKAGEPWLCQGDTPLLASRALRLVGQHNLANALAALSLGHVAGLALPAMLQALKEYSGLAHRAQWVAEKAGVVWYNDSKATNVGASIAALQGMPGSVVWIAGGDGKGADFSPLSAVVQAKVRAAILLGRDSPVIAKAIASAKVPVYEVAGMAQAVAQAHQQAQLGDSVLLSPACASWDMYGGGFAQRGEDYVHWVKETLK